MSEADEKGRKKLLDKILSGEIEDKQELERRKRKISKVMGLSKVPSNAEILEEASQEEREQALPILQRKPIRSISGVTVITVMPKPYPCPKDEPCIYCPGGPEDNTPQSYTGEEPASARAKNANYDPVKQIKARKNQLKAIGHKVDKVELIIFGGTFLSQPQEYQKKFIHSCLDTISETNTRNLEEAKKKAETAETRTIGITFETRPDYCRKEQIKNILRYGGTRVEVGVQTVYQDIYDKVNREHTIEDVIEATQEAKDSGLAVVYHMMPGLPGSSKEKDMNSLKEIFENPQFRPDMLKLYPCLVMKGTKLYDQWKKGEFDPLEGKEAIDLIADMKENIPPWVRIQRIQRDIPSDLIEAGVQKGNLRTLAKKELKDRGKKCDCIRCREVGHRMMKNDADPELKNAELLTREYEASGGKEVFISFENPDRDIIFGHLRLRIPSDKVFRPEINKNTALVRMLYVFGKLVTVGNETKENAWQHKGFGRKMLRRAEKIGSEEYGADEISILSGIGTRPYYRKFGYELEGPYMKKEI